MYKALLSRRTGDGDSIQGPFMVSTQALRHSSVNYHHNTSSMKILIDPREEINALVPVVFYCADLVGNRTWPWPAHQPTPYGTMATASKEPNFSELVARITTLYNHASKADDKVVVDALKASASQASEELLTLVGILMFSLSCLSFADITFQFDQYPVAHEASLATHDRGSDRTLVATEFKHANVILPASFGYHLVITYLSA